MLTKMEDEDALRLPLLSIYLLEKITYLTPFDRKTKKEEREETWRMEDERDGRRNKKWEEEEPTVEKRDQN